jgi:hypothetical protein
MIAGRSATQNAGPQWAGFSQSARRMLYVPLLGILTLITPLVSAWAAVYQCIDKTGQTVLTNRQAGFRQCRVIIEDPVASTKSSPGRKPKSSTEPTDLDLAPAFSDGLTPMPPPNDIPAPRMDTPNPSPSPPMASPLHPCPPGVNTLNALNDVPCSPSVEPQQGGMGSPR